MTMSREVIKTFDEHFVWTNLWCNKYSNSVMKTYHEKLQYALKIRVLNSVISSYYKVPMGHKGVKAFSRTIGSPIVRESIRNDFLILSALLTNNPFFFGNEPTPHDLEAFSNLAQLRLLYKEIQYPILITMEYYYDFYLLSVISPIEEYVSEDSAIVCATLDLSVEQQKTLYLLRNFQKVFDIATHAIKYNKLHLKEEIKEATEENDEVNNEQEN